MGRSVRDNVRFAIALAVLLAVLIRHRSAVAQRCSTIPNLDENECASIGNSIDDYKRCYRALYDNDVIPAFRYIASCSHARADAALLAGLESAASVVTGTIKESIAAIEAALAGPNGAAGCFDQLKDIDAKLELVITREKAAPDLDAHRRNNYDAEDLTSFMNLVLGARQNRAACSDALLRIRQRLVLLSELKARHLDYCKVLRDSARYENASRILSLAQWTAIDPNIHFDHYFNASITWNVQCGYFDLSDAGSSIRYTPCLQNTAEYTQTLSEIDRSLVGWLSDNRNAIVAVSAAAGSTIASLAGAGASAGPLGASIGLVVGAIIAGIDYWMLRSALDELHDLIADKEQELKDVVAQRYITEPAFHARLEELCSTWQPVVEERIEHMLAGLHAAEHIQDIDAYFARSDKLHDWYNELFLWATKPGPGGQRFIDVVTEQALLAQRDAFDRQLFRARTDQEIAKQKNLLAALKGNTSLLGCTNIPSPQRRSVQAQLRGGLYAFNVQCASLMQALAVRTEGPVPFTDPSATSDVSCAYNGFRSDVTSLEIRAGAGSAADMTLRDPAGTVIAELTGVTSDRAPGFAGFGCASESGAPFGTSAASRLTPGTYPLHVADSIYGFGVSEAQALRPFLQDVDSKMRFKAVVCNRQLGTPIDLPRTADACGIPVTF